MTWLFRMNSSEGSQVTIRDLRMPPSLGDTTGGSLPRHPPNSLKEELRGAHEGGGPLQDGTLELVGIRGTQAWTDRRGHHGPVHTCTHIPRLSCRRRLTFAIRSTKNDGISLAAVVIF